VDVGNEDGPTFHYSIDNKTRVGKNGLKILCNACGDIYLNQKRAEGSNLLDIIRKYNITDFMEVHDWYDFIDPKDAKDMEKELKKDFYNSKLPHNKKIKYVLVTINQYNVTPRKYLIPKSAYKKSLSLKVFEKKMAKYEVEASYKRLVTDYNLISHNYYIYDLIDPDDEDDKSETTFVEE
jgi:hypothetical protein